MAILASQTTPPSMSASHPFGRGVTHQNRQAIGRHDGACHTGLCGPSHISLKVGRCVFGDVYALCAMNLPKVNSGYTQPFFHQSAIGMNVFSFVTRQETQVEGIPWRCRHTPFSGCHESLHVLGCWPLRLKTDQGITRHRGKQRAEPFGRLLTSYKHQMRPGSVATPLSWSQNAWH